jgi:hypothetical protein
VRLSVRRFPYFGDAPVEAEGVVSIFADFASARRGKSRDATASREDQIAAKAFKSFTPSGTPQPLTASNPTPAL